MSALENDRGLSIVLALCRNDRIPEVAAAVLASEWIKEHDAAVREAAIEEAAAIAESTRPEIGSHINESQYRAGKYDGATLAAVAIRAVLVSS